MKFSLKNPPRVFRVGAEGHIEISDCGDIELEANEQVTFLTPSGKAHDFAAKSWGFYGTPSVNGRLKDQGFKTALVRNAFGKIYIMVVDENEMQAFTSYLAEEKNDLLEWLDER